MVGLLDDLPGDPDEENESSETEVEFELLS